MCEYTLPSLRANCCGGDEKSPAYKLKLDMHTWLVVTILIRTRLDQVWFIHFPCSVRIAALGLKKLGALMLIRVL